VASLGAVAFGEAFACGCVVVRDGAQAKKLAMQRIVIVKAFIGKF